MRVTHETITRAAENNHLGITWQEFLLHLLCDVRDALEKRNSDLIEEGRKKERLDRAREQYAIDQQQ